MDQLTTEQKTEIRDALRQGKKIEAIKIYREATHCELKEAKDAIDALHNQLSAANPSEFPRKTTGCGSALLLLTLILALVFK